MFFEIFEENFSSFCFWVFLLATEIDLVVVGLLVPVERERLKLKMRRERGGGGGRT